MSQNQQQTTVPEAAQELHNVLQDKTTMNGRELDAARAALGFLVNNCVVLSRVVAALKTAAEAAGVDANAVIVTAAQAQRQADAPVATNRAERRRNGLESVKPQKKKAAAQE